MPKPKRARSYQFSEETDQILSRMASELGLTKTAVLQLGVRLLARLAKEDVLRVAATSKP